MEEVLEDPHLKARDMVHEVTYPPYGSFKTLGCPVILSDSPTEITPPPQLGEHSASVLAELCGVDESEFNELTKSGVTG